MVCKQWRTQDLAVIEGSSMRSEEGKERGTNQVPLDPLVSSVHAVSMAISPTKFLCENVS